MSRSETGIPYRADNDQASAYRLFNQLTKRIVQIGLLKISTRRNIDDANLILVFVCQNPAHTTLDICLRNTPAFADLHQHKFRFRSNSSIEAIRKVSISCCDNGSHHSMPAGYVGSLQKCRIVFSGKNAVIGDDAIDWLG